MKRRSLLAMILSLVMCLGLVMPAWAAEATPLQMSEIEFVNLDDGKLAVQVDSATEFTVDIVNESVKISEADILAAYNSAQTALMEESQPVAFSNDDSDIEYGSFDYTLYTDDATYFYEESPDGQKKEMIIMEGIPLLTQEDNLSVDAVEDLLDDMKTSVMAIGSQQVNLPDGIGGRLRISTSAGTYITGTIQTPLKSQVSGVNLDKKIANYIYTGFSGITGSNQNIEIDVGLQYQQKDTNGGWNHYFLYRLGSAKPISQDEVHPDGPDVTGSNYFLTSDSSNTRDISFTTYKNKDQCIRSSLTGYARYQTQSGPEGSAPGAYWKTSVKEIDINVGTINSWKFLNTLTSETETGLKSWCKFKNVKINGATLSENILQNQLDYATMSSSLSSGAITSTISVSK